MPITPEDQIRIREATETVRNLQSISDMLGTGLDIHALRVCVNLIEAGANPENLAAVILELRKEKAKLEASTVKQTK